MKFVVFLDPQLVLFAYSAKDLPNGNVYFFRSIGADEQIKEQPPVNRFDLLHAGFVEITTFSTRGLTINSHFRALSKLRVLFQNYLNSSDHVNESARYANPLNAMLQWARHSLTVGTHGQPPLSMRVMPLLLSSAGPSKYDFCR